MTTTTRQMNLTPPALRPLSANSRTRYEPPTAPVPAPRRATLQAANPLALGAQHTAIPPVRTGYDKVTGLPSPQSDPKTVVGLLVLDLLPVRTGSSHRPQGASSRSRDVA